MGNFNIVGAILLLASIALIIYIIIIIFKKLKNKVFFSSMK
ncbi:hypothetical protein AX25_09485 [Listeria ivanovii WSLC3009]|nr:hypothetical protein AX25_09485 [Listeria ivanovii WSLC3009]